MNISRSNFSFVVLLSVLAILGVLPLSVELYSQAEPRAGTATPSTGNGPNKYALLVGIDNYKNSNQVSPLEGSVNDVQDMRQVLIGKFDFPPENILVLTDAQATHAGIIRAIQDHLIAKAHEGDIVVFDYSGHGAQMQDVTGRIGGLDETIVPYDSRDPEGKVFDISGAEMHPLLVQLTNKTKNVTYILDSCHSGTLVRGARTRSIPADTREVSPAYIQSVNALTRGVSAADNSAPPKFAFISAATSKENAFEYAADGKHHGALTYFLAQQLRAAGAGATYRDVMDSVIGNVSAQNPSQHPSLEGVEQDQHIFGDGSSLAHAYVVANPSATDPHRVTLEIGQVEGATVGSVYEVFPPHSKKFAPPDTPLARVQIASVGAFTAEATVSGGIKIPPASRAVERQHRYGSARMRVFFDGPPDSQALQAIKDALQNVKQIEVVEKPTLCNMQVRESGGTLQTLGSDSTTRSTPVPVSDPHATERVVEQLRGWARWFAAFSIRNPQSAINLGFTLKGSQTRDPMARVGRPDMGVTVGEVVDATLTNNFERDLYVAMLDLSSDGSIDLVFPPEGSQAVLKAGTSFTRSLKTSLPPGRRYETDVLMAFASFQPIGLKPLTQKGIRGIDDIEDENETNDPLQQLLNDSGGKSRGVEVVLTGPPNLGSWITALRILLIKSAH